MTTKESKKCPRCHGDRWVHTGRYSKPCDTCTGDYLTAAERACLEWLAVEGPTPRVTLIEQNYTEGVQDAAYSIVTRGLAATSADIYKITDAGRRLLSK